MFNGSAYKTLGLKEGASAEEIKTAYRRLAMKHHPDRGGDPEEFKKIQSAYDYLNSVGDHVQLRKRARPDNSNFNYSFFNQAEMAEIFKNLRENLSSLVIEIPEISWYDAIHGTDKIKQGVPPGGSFINGDKMVKVRKINLKSGLSFRNKFVSTDEMFVGDLIGTIGLTDENLENGCWVSIEDPFEDQKLKVRVPAGSKFGQMLKIKSKGYWNWKRGPISRADLFVTLEKK